MYYGMYEGFIRPCIFKLDPETAHNLIMKSMSIASNNEFLTSLISHFCRFQSSDIKR